MLKINTENNPQQTNFLLPPQDSLAEVSPADSETTESAGVNEGENKKPVASVGNAIAHTVSPKKLAANKGNAKKSTGPKTAAGKAISSRNAVKHGLLSARLTQLNDQNAKDFAHVLAILQQDLQPEGVLEEILVEKIAYEYFRMAAAAQHYNDAALYVVNTSGGGPGNLLRYDSMINRQLFQAINQLERLQRLRRGEDVPAPLNVQI
ncbi:MAG: hypothetical protein DMG76_15280 [Acidobacteria bacterium]|nr:MAG: hypothetical protein DMG76_15280 [Acidobacteriota bacterium]